MTPGPTPNDGVELPPDPAAALDLARSTGRTVRDGSWWTAAVTVGSELLGGLVLHRDAALSDADQRILERAALVTALLLLIRRTAGEAENRVRGELLEELLGSTVRDPDGVRERARRLGADLDRPHAVVVVRVEERCRARALAAAAHVAATRGGLAGTHDGCVVLCLPDLAPGVAASTVHRELGNAGAGRSRSGRPDRPRSGRRRRGARGGGPLRRDARRARPHRRIGQCRGARLLRTAGRGRAGRARLRRGHAGPRARVRRPARHRPGGHPPGVLRRGGIPGPRRRDAPGARQHRHPAAGPGEPVDRQGWSSPERALEIQLALRLHRLTGAVPD